MQAGGTHPTRILSCLLGIRSWKLSRQVHEVSPGYLENETGSASKDVQQFKAVKTLAVVLGVFVLAYLPDGVYSLIVPNFDKGTGNSTTAPA